MKLCCSPKLLQALMSPWYTGLQARGKVLSAQTVPAGKSSWARQGWQTFRLWLCPHTNGSRNINLFKWNRLNKRDKKPWKILKCMIDFDTTVGVKHILTFPHLLLDYKLGVHLQWCLSVFCKICTQSSISYGWLEGIHVAFAALNEHSSHSPKKSLRLMPLSCDLWPAW